MLEEQSEGKAPKETCEKENQAELKKEENTAVRQVFQQNNPPLVDARGDPHWTSRRKQYFTQDGCPSLEQTTVRVHLEKPCGKSSVRTEPATRC